MMFDNALIIKMPLNARGYTNVDVFTDSITALNNFQADYYDLIVIDVRMPYMNGFELYKKIKEHAKSKDLLFICYREYL